MTQPSQCMRRLSATAGDIAIAANILRASGLVAFPTETVYGLGADARNDAAVQKLFAAKARPPGKALIVLVQDLREAGREGCALSAEINPDGATVALRAPGNETAMTLLRAFAGPLTAPSANPSGAEAPESAEEVLNGLGSAIDAVLDGGSCPGSASTIVDLTSGAPRLLRQGAISRQRIEETLRPLRLS